LPEFRIVQHKRDVKLLHKVRNFFDYGTVVTNHGDVRELRIRGLKNLNKLVSFFREHQLQTTKRFSFELFAQIIDLMNEGKHGNPEGVAQIAKLAEQMNNKKKRTLESSETIRRTNILFEDIVRPQ